MYDENRMRVLEALVDRLRDELTLQAREITLIKNEGCWRFHQDPEHEHK